MGVRFRKSMRIAPGVRLNFGKKGLTSVSVGRAGATVNLNADGAKTTVGLPGTGLSYSTARHSADELAPRRPGSRLALILVMVAIVLLVLLIL